MAQSCITLANWPGQAFRCLVPVGPLAQFCPIFCPKNGPALYHLGKVGLAKLPDIWSQLVHCLSFVLYPLPNMAQLFFHIWPLGLTKLPDVWTELVHRPSFVLYHVTSMAYPCPTLPGQALESKVPVGPLGQFCPIFCVMHGPALSHSQPLIPPWATWPV